MKTLSHVNLATGLKYFMISLALIWGTASTIQAATTGFNQTGAGSWDYNAGENCVGVTICLIAVGWFFIKKIIKIDV